MKALLSNNDPLMNHTDEELEMMHLQITKPTSPIRAPGESDESSLYEMSSSYSDDY